MKKKPKVYQNKVCKQQKEKKVVIKESNFEEEVEINVEEKLDKLFKSFNYVYKLDLEITTESGTNVERVIGKKDDSLLTIENKLIPIKSIKNVKIKTR